MTDLVETGLAVGGGGLGLAAVVIAVAKYAVPALASVWRHRAKNAAAVTVSGNELASEQLARYDARLSRTEARLDECEAKHEACEDNRRKDRDACAEEIKAVEKRVRGELAAVRRSLSPPGGQRYDLPSAGSPIPEAVLGDWSDDGEG